MRAIARQLLQESLSVITVGYFNHHDVAAEDLHDYDTLIEDIRRGAERRGELEDLRASIDYVLSRPELDAEEFSGGRYLFDDDDMRAIMYHVRETIWPGSPPPSRAVTQEVVLSDEPLQDWRASRGRAPSGGVVTE